MGGVELRRREWGCCSMEGREGPGACGRLVPLNSWQGLVGELETGAESR